MNAYEENDKIILDGMKYHERTCFQMHMAIFTSYEILRPGSHNGHYDLKHKKVSENRLDSMTRPNFHVLMSDLLDCTINMDLPLPVLHKILSDEI